MRFKAIKIAVKKEHLSAYLVDPTFLEMDCESPVASIEKLVKYCIVKLTDIASFSSFFFFFSPLNYGSDSYLCRCFLENKLLHIKAQ